MTKSRLLVSLMVIAMAAALIGGATMAWFTDSDEAEPITMTAGTLLIDMTELQLIEEFAEVDLEILNPGDTWAWEFEVENVGTKSFNWGIYACWQDIIGQLNEALDEEMRALLEEKGYGSDELSKVLEWEVYVDYGDGEELLVEGVLPEEGPVGAYMEPIAAGDDPVKVRIVALLPGEGTGNEYQGSTMKLALGVMAWQTTNGAPAPTLDDVVCPFGEGEDPGEDPDYSMYTATFWASNTQTQTSGGSKHIGSSPVRIENAKDQDGNLINGKYKVELYMDVQEKDEFGNIVAPFEYVADFTEGKTANFTLGPWQFESTGGFKIPNDVKVRFISAVE